MKLKLITCFAVLAFASVGIVGLSHAQDDETEKANIPFDFYVGAKKMPAGRYSIGSDLEGQMITFTDESGKQRIFPDGNYCRRRWRNIVAGFQAFGECVWARRTQEQCH
jgi:hypothetical protein